MIIGGRQPTTICDCSMHPTTMPMLHSIGSKSNRIDISRSSIYRLSVAGPWRYFATIHACYNAGIIGPKMPGQGRRCVARPNGPSMLGLLHFANHLKAQRRTLAARSAPDCYTPARSAQRLRISSITMLWSAWSCWRLSPGASSRAYQSIRAAIMPSAAMLALSPRAETQENQPELLPQNLLNSYLLSTRPAFFVMTYRVLSFIFTMLYLAENTENIIRKP
jgi:hypothetical protein